MKGRRIQWRFGGQMLGWGTALAAGALLLAWADWQRMARTHFADIALLLVAALFLGLGLWLGFSVWNKSQQPPGNPAAVASLGLTPREVEVLGLLAAGQAITGDGGDHASPCGDGYAIICARQGVRVCHPVG